MDKNQVDGLFTGF